MGLLLAAIISSWVICKFGCRFLNLPPAGATAIEETVLQSQKAGLPIPKVCEVPTKGTFAQSIGPSPDHATIILSPAFQDIPREEQAAGIAHELAHVRNWDPFWTAVFITGLAVFEIIAITASLDRWFVGIVLVLLVAVPWGKELRADALGGRNCGSPGALANLLGRMKTKDLPIKMVVYPFLSLFLIPLTSSPPINGLAIILIALMLGLCLPTHPPTFYRRWRLNKGVVFQAIPQ